MPHPNGPNLTSGPAWTSVPGPSSNEAHSSLCAPQDNTMLQGSACRLWAESTQQVGEPTSIARCSLWCRTEEGAEAARGCPVPLRSGTEHGAGRESKAQTWPLVLFRRRSCPGGSTKQHRLTSAKYSDTRCPATCPLCGPPSSNLRENKWLEFSPCQSSA